MSCAGNPLTLPPHEPRGTSNIEHPTPNIEWQRESLLTSAFGVRCWTFDVFPRFSGDEGRGKGEGSLWAFDNRFHFGNLFWQMFCILRSASSRVPTRRMKVGERAAHDSPS